MESPMGMLRNYIGQHLKNQFDETYATFVSNVVVSYNKDFLRKGKSSCTVAGLFFITDEDRFDTKCITFDMETDDDRTIYTEAMGHLMMGALQPAYLVAFVTSHEAWMTDDKTYCNDIAEGKLQVSQLPNKKEVIFHFVENVFYEQQVKMFNIQRAKASIQLNQQMLDKEIAFNGRLTDLFSSAEDGFDNFLARYKRPPYPIPNLKPFNHGDPKK